jgi:hypothetical protein
MKSLLNSNIKKFHKIRNLNLLKFKLCPFAKGRADERDINDNRRDINQNFDRNREDRKDKEYTGQQGHNQGEPSGKTDREGHHLREDNRPDLRFKENNPDAGNPGRSNDNRGEFSGKFDRQGHHLKSDGTPDNRFKENNPDAGNPGPKNDHRGEFSGEYDRQGHHLKTDGNHDMRFKENKDSGIESPEQEEGRRGRR